MYRASCSGGKKGFLALEALIGTILSVVALVFLFSLFSNLLPTDENEVIATKNAESIVNFVNYFQEDPNYASLENCYNILQLNYQTFFQYVEEGKENYIYLISKEGVYLVPFSKLPLFYDQVKDNNYNFNDYYLVEKFEREVSLFYDNTDKTSYKFFTDLFFISDELNLELEKISNIDEKEFYLLKPQVTYTEDKILSYLPFIADESNGYDVSLFENEFILSDNLEYLSNPFYLVYSNNNLIGDTMLFITNSKYTIPQIKNNLCSQKYFSNIVFSSFYENAENIDKFDYNNFEIVFEDFISKENTYSFSWKNRPICKKNSIETNCKDILILGDLEYYQDKNFEITYKDFIVELKALLKDKSLNINTGDLEIKNIIPLNSNEIVSPKIYFNDIFTSLDFSDIDKTRLDDKDYLKINNFFDITQFNNDEINGCEHSYCNLLKMKNNIFYFYTGGVEESGFIFKEIDNLDLLKYYSFNELFLRKKEILIDDEISYDLYFNGKIIEYEKFTPEQKGISIPFYDDPELEPYAYRFVLDNIINEGEEYSIEVFLTSYQFRRIQKLNEVEE